MIDVPLKSVLCSSLHILRVLEHEAADVCMLSSRRRSGLPIGPGSAPVAYAFTRNTLFTYCLACNGKTLSNMQYETFSHLTWELLVFYLHCVSFLFFCRHILVCAVFKLEIYFKVTFHPEFRVLPSAPAPSSRSLVSLHFSSHACST